VLFRNFFIDNSVPSSENVLSLCEKLRVGIDSIMMLGITPIDYDGCGNDEDELVDLLGKANYKEWIEHSKKNLGLEHQTSKINFNTANKFIKRDHSFLTQQKIKGLLDCCSK
jgi:hypothetical protein